MNTPAWFGVGQVRPIAEPALACPERRLTAAHVRAGGPWRPAFAGQATVSGRDRVAPDPHGRHAVAAYWQPWPAVVTAAVL